MLVRTWNLFNGNTLPPGRCIRIEAMVGLVAADGPDAVCLQEVPLWALPRLAAWSDLQAVGDTARGRRLPAPLDRWVTGLHSGLIRSAFTGQANAILLAPHFRIAERSVFVLQESTRFGTGASERRICQVLRIIRPDQGTLVLANLHAANSAALAREQVVRAADHVLTLAGRDEPIVLAGDFNVAPELADRGFAGGGHAIDHIFVRGLTTEGQRAWPDERRLHEGVLLSDHAPVEARLG